MNNICPNLIEVMSAFISDLEVAKKFGTAPWKTYLIFLHGITVLTTASLEGVRTCLPSNIQNLFTPPYTTCRGMLQHVRVKITSSAMPMFYNTRSNVCSCSPHPRFFATPEINVRLLFLYTLAVLLFLRRLTWPMSATSHNQYVLRFSVPDACIITTI